MPSNSPSRPESAPPAEGKRPTLGRLLLYPLRGNGIFLLIGYSLLVFLFQLGVSLHLGFLSPVIAVLGGGYACAYFYRIAATAARGRDSLPMQPDFTDWEDVGGPLLRMLAILVGLYGPGLIYRWVTGRNDGRYWALLLAGDFFVPLAVLSVAVRESLLSINPFSLIRAFLRMPADYARFALGYLALRHAVERGYLHLPGIISAFATAFVEIGLLYLAIVYWYALGVLYRRSAARLAWFPRAG